MWICIVILHFSYLQLNSQSPYCSVQDGSIEREILKILFFNVILF